MAYTPDNPLQTLLDTGSEAFAATWRQWVNQWTQPKLLRIAETYLGGRMFHSSQMTGFATRKLQNPAPKAFLAIGALNVAHARSLGFPEDKIEPTPDLGLPKALPGSLRDLWDAREPLLDASGVAMGPTGLFEAFCGLRNLPEPLPVRELPQEAAQAASMALGGRLRLSLAQRGIDWVPELPQLAPIAPSIEPLLQGRVVPSDRLSQDLPRIAHLLQTTEDALWHELTTQVGLSNTEDTDAPR